MSFGFAVRAMTRVRLWAKRLRLGLRELDPVTGTVVGLEVWQASRVLPADLLRVLPSPQGTGIEDKPR